VIEFTLILNDNPMQLPLARYRSSQKPHAFDFDWPPAPSPQSIAACAGFVNVAFVFMNPKVQDAHKLYFGWPRNRSNSPYFRSAPSLCRPLARAQDHVPALTHAPCPGMLTLGRTCQRLGRALASAPLGMPVDALGRAHT